MEKELRARLVDFMHYLTEENIRPRHYHAGTVVDNFLKSTNCLEANPKALHSMKEDEKSHNDMVSRSDIVEAIVKSKLYYEGIGRFDYSNGLDKARYIAATHGKEFEF